MPGPFEKESKVLLWIVLGPIVLGLLVTFIYLNFITNNIAPLQDSKSFATDPTSPSNSGISQHQSQSNDPRKNIYADPPAEQHGSALDGPLSDEVLDKALNKRMAEGQSGHDNHLPNASVSIDEGLNSGSYSTAVAMVVKSKISGIKYCFEKQLRNYPNLAGKVVVAWTIGTNGDVVKYNIESSTVDNLEVGACMLRMIRRWRFPAPSDGEVNISYPFNFTAQK